MGLYGNVWKDQVVENKEYTNEEIKDALLEVYSDIIESYENEDSEDLVTEGANLDMRKIWKESSKKAKDHIKAYKTAMKSEDYKKAVAEIGAAKKILVENKKKLEEVTDADDFGSLILGFFAYDLYTTFELFIPGIAAGAALSMLGQQVAQQLAAPVGNIMKIIAIVRDIKALQDSMKENKENLDGKHFNMYRTKLIRYMADGIKRVENLEEAAKKKASESKSDKKEDKKEEKK